MRAPLAGWCLAALGWACAPQSATAQVIAASFAATQVVTAPALDAAMIRARLARLIDGKPLPADAPALDAMLARGDGAALTRRLLDTSAPAQLDLDRDWERRTLFDGGGFLVAYAYMTDLWRVGTATPAREADGLKQSAASIFVYALVLTRLDGVRCADPTAPAHRREQLFAQNQAIVTYLRALPRPTRMTIGSLALVWERATAALRCEDRVLCADGLDAMAAGFGAPGATLRPVPAAPGTVGRTFAVPPAPGYRPGFVDAAQAGPIQDQRRLELPAFLTTFLTVPGEASGPPPTPPRR